MRGHRVLLVDLDPQGSATTLFGVLPDAEVETEHTSATLPDPTAASSGTPSRPRGNLLALGQSTVLLFLLAAGLTLVFGIMSFVNLAHGSLYMMGAYFAASAFQYTGSFGLAVLAAMGGSLLLGLLLEFVAVARVSRRSTASATAGCTCCFAWASAVTA